MNALFNLKYHPPSLWGHRWGSSAFAAIALGLTLACGGGGGGGGTPAPPAGPAITSFMAAKSPITVGESTTLTAVFANGTGAVDNSVGAVTTGTPVTVTPATDTIYTLTVTGAAGTTPATKTATVTVVAAPDATVTAPAYVTGSKTGYTASVPDQTGSTYAWTITGATPTTSTDRSVTFTPNATGTVHLSCIVTNTLGKASDPGVADCTIVAAPTISSFTPAKSPITLGGSTTLTADFANGTGTVNQGVGPVISTTPVSVSPLVDTTYLLTVTNLANTSVTSTTAIAVVAAPATPVITIPSTPSPTTLTATQTYTASVTAQAGCTYTWSLTGATAISGGTSADSSIEFSAGAIGNTIVLDCTVTNAAGTGAAAVTKTYSVVAPVNKVLTVTITGVTPADVDISGLATQKLTATGTIDCAGLADGTLTITANDVTDAGSVKHYPWQRTYSVTVSGGVPSVNALTVSYPQPALTVQIPDLAAPPTTVPMDFVLVPPGSFQMGAAANTWDSNWLDATPKHSVTIPHAFYVAKFECTQKQWLAMIATNPSYFAARGGFTDDFTRPVDYVSWNLIRNATTGFLPTLNTQLPGYGFRLPSEAEWEYFTRAGTTTDYFFGDSFNPLLSTFAVWDQPDIQYDINGDAIPNTGGPTSPVGQKLPNAWGLYDVLGNVWEWCEDDSHGTPYHPNTTGNPVTTDGSGYLNAPATGSAWVDSPRGPGRILRGGGWSGNDSLSPRSAFRYDRTPDYRESTFGFRVVMDIAP